MVALRDQRRARIIGGENLEDFLEFPPMNAERQLSNMNREPFFAFKEREIQKFPFFYSEEEALAERFCCRQNVSITSMTAKNRAVAPYGRGQT